MKSLAQSVSDSSEAESEVWTRGKTWYSNLADCDKM